MRPDGLPERVLDGLKKGVALERLCQKTCAVGRRGVGFVARAHQEELWANEPRLDDLHQRNELGGGVRHGDRGQEQVDRLAAVDDADRGVGVAAGNDGEAGAREGERDAATKRAVVFDQQNALAAVSNDRSPLLGLALSLRRACLTGC
jgi:hypothetical protein